MRSINLSTTSSNTGSDESRDSPGNNPTTNGYMRMMEDTGASNFLDVPEEGNEGAESERNRTRGRDESGDNVRREEVISEDEASPLSPETLLIMGNYSLLL